jgi:hypothetical protein
VVKTKKKRKAEEENNFVEDDFGLPIVMASHLRRLEHSALLWLPQISSNKLVTRATVLNIKTFGFDYKQEIPPHVSFMEHKTSHVP